MKKKGNAVLVALCVALLMGTLMPASSGDEGGSFPVFGYVLDEEGFGIEDADVVVTNLESEDFLEEITDEDGYWEVDCEAFDPPWENADPIEIEITIPERAPFMEMFEITESMNQWASWYQYLGGNEPNCYWIWDTNGGNYKSSWYSKFPLIPIVKQTDLSGKVTLDVDMRFEDKRVFWDQDPECHHTMKFWISDTTQNGLFDKDYESDEEEFFYPDAPYDSTWVDLSITFTPPGPDTSWYLTFEQKGYLMIDPYPSGTYWGGWSWSWCAAWVTTQGGS